MGGKICSGASSMALQICPKCKVKSITWFIDDEASAFTQWLCDSCGYLAEEEEVRECDCLHCGGKKMSLLVRDKDGLHRWCCACNVFENTIETFASS